MMIILRSKQKGIAAVEMIIVTPILLLLLVGVYEISRIFIQYTVLNKAVQSGARYALLDVYGAQPQGTLSPTAQIKNVVVYGKKSSGTESEKRLPNLGTSNVSVDTTDSSHVTITATYSYTPVFAQLPFTTKSLAMDLNASATMRRVGN
ncbi:TadE/TadG family type IV pilus assembly protein [Vibrio breoganii]|uniref:TadE/TadG family type IV pilus assembly protein n=1 Tax=Vibrio breoganii TaxID=553239 RepID=UPI000C83DE19|nr:TadE/TadG family type IV pilus assembly protein [Vibrio breoganii]